VNLLFTIDVDNDGVEDDERTALTWKSIERIPQIGELFASFNLCLTWFVRADNQLKEVYGSAAYLLQQHQALWSQLEAAGDELGWHPHLYEWCADSRKFVADKDEQRCARKLIETRTELLAHDFVHSSVRIGEGFHSNAMMRALSDLGLQVDSTAIPGRVRDDASRSFDWGPTPNRPYYPSAADYRVPDAGDSLKILEIPMTTMPVKASYDRDSLTRYINPAFHHANFKAGLDRSFDSLFPTGQSECFITLILHSDEVSAEGRAHPLYSFSLETVRQNITYLLESLEARDLEYRSLRLKDVLSKRPQPEWESA
jgi:hypothetical protein